MLKKKNIAVISNVPESLIDNGNGTYTSCSWKLKFKDLGQYLGSRFSIHRSQQTESFIQGTIVGFFQDQVRTDRVRIMFKADSTIVEGKGLPWAQMIARWESIEKYEAIVSNPPYIKNTPEEITSKFLDKSSFSI